jgi:hypothetical protein
MAPEALEGRPESKSDLFSLGVAMAQYYSDVPMMSRWLEWVGPDCSFEQELGERWYFRVMRVAMLQVVVRCECGDGSMLRLAFFIAQCTLENADHRPLPSEALRWLETEGVADTEWLGRHIERERFELRDWVVAKALEPEVLQQVLRALQVELVPQQAVAPSRFAPNPYRGC